MPAFDEVARLEMVREFQYEHDVSRLAVGGLRVWPIVLLQLVKLTAANYGFRSALDVARLAFGEAAAFGKMAYAKWRDRARSSDPRRPADALFLTNPTRRARIEGVYYDRICDPFVDALRRAGRRAAVLEWSFDHEYRVPRHNPSALVQDSIDRVVLSSLLRRRALPLELDLLGTDRFRRILDYHRSDPRAFGRDLVRSARFTLALRDYFLRTLKDTGASVAFYFPWYGAVSFGFNLACRALGIRTVEIQHGYYGDAMLLYTGFRNVTCRYELLPDHIWGWEERDRQAVRAWGDDPRLLPQVHVGGNLWNNLWQYPEANDNRFARPAGSKTASPVAARRALAPDGRRLVLLTLPPVFDIPGWLPGAIAATAGTMNWAVRFHHHMKPAAAARYRQALGGLANAEYELANALPLPVLLSLCDVHVTVNSSSAAEAREFGRRTVITSETGSRIFAALIEQRWACSAGSGDELRAALDRFLAESQTANPLAASAPAGVKDNSRRVRDFIAGLA